MVNQQSPVTEGVSMASKVKGKLIVVIDPGSSGIKVFYWFEGSERVNYLYVESEYIVLPESSASELPASSAMGRAEDNCWIRYHKNGECHLVGRTALEFSARFNFKTLKIDYVVAKVAAILGIIGEKESLESKFAVTLGLLLPLDEITNTATKELLKSSLKQTVKSFYYRDRRLQVILEDLSVVPEGYGVAMYDHRHRHDFTAWNWGYLVCGQKHNSFLYFPNGTLSLKHSSSDRRGFVNLADLICQKVPGLKRDELLKIFKTYRLRGRKNPRSLVDLKTEKDFQRLSSNSFSVESLELAYQKSLAQYWALFENWLNDILPPKKDIFSLTRIGGYSELLAPQLRKFFAPRNVFIPPGINDKLIAALGFANNLSSREAERFIRLNPIRFADAWNFFAVFSGYLDFISQSSQNSEQKLQ